ncbi:MAG: UDP-N-acetylglucosamine--N-acetylmuramyl-(pentapeptide) pyrophosphoryl-undecaprenol N-acetylglucosamine transferase [Gemmatimonadaceae bacterium]|nr:UDP-N-acetylglucosamine--N-acetylmuramyl-(pentapeptide) pyrophosphoryl-undecaprenol N-acetylglucosamine transferase [Gemmatimonadaceae bacterium]
MTIIFAGGGTGGHLYPGLAIARAMVRIDPQTDPFFIGAQRGIEKDVLPGAGFEHELLDLHPLYRARPWENWKTLRGAISAWRRIGERVKAYKPAAVVGTGGYASGLTLAYAAVKKIPFAIQEQNTFPGLTTRFFSRYASQIHLGFPEARAHLKPSARTKVFNSGNPIEPPPADARDKRAGRAAWEFPPDRGTVLLVYGGSQGSQAMNEAVAGWVRSGTPDDLFIIWATGRGNHEQYSALESERVKVRPYLSPVSDAYRAADLALSRAGAMATAELCAWGLPMILVPLPTAAADHQTANARALEAAGAAQVILQSAMSPAALSAAVSSLLSDPPRLAALSAYALERARPLAAEHIAQAILELADVK